MNNHHPSGGRAAGFASGLGPQPGPTAAGQPHRLVLSLPCKGGLVARRGRTTIKPVPSLRYGPSVFLSRGSADPVCSPSPLDHALLPGGMVKWLPYPQANWVEAGLGAQVQVPAMGNPTGRLQPCFSWPRRAPQGNIVDREHDFCALAGSRRGGWCLFSGDFFSME